MYDAIEMGSGGMIYIQSLMMIYPFWDLSNIKVITATV
jgi:hypothetical protein